MTSRRYQARCYHLGKQVPAETTFATKAEARAWLATIETDILGGRHINPTSGRELFCVYAARWLEAPDLRPRTRDTYASQLIHILADFENVELRQIAPASVRAWHGRLAKSGLHANTVAKIYRLFRTMMDTAVDDGLLRVNPVHIKGAAAERSVERRASDSTLHADTRCQVSEVNINAARVFFDYPTESSSEKGGRRPEMLRPHILDVPVAWPPPIIGARRQRNNVKGGRFLFIAHADV